jgi:histidine triad (HIT) family protein
MSAPKTLFQKIADKEIPAKLIHEDAVCVAFHDIAPQAPTHVLIVPRKPIPRVAEAIAVDQAVLGHLLLVAGQLSRQLGLAKGFRIVINNGPDGGETVPHLHVHLLGGRALDWPPG